jgi:hypothetical protein
VVPAIILQEEVHVIIISAGVFLELMPTCRAIQGMLFMSSHVRDVANITSAKQATLSVPGVPMNMDASENGRSEIGIQ